MVVLVKIEEVVSTKKCYELLTKGKLRTQDKNTLKDLHKSVIKTGAHVANYHFGEDPLHSYNCCKRLQAKNSSVSKLESKVRNYLLYEDYQELDIKNCAVSILLNIIKNNKDNFTDTELHLIQNYFLNKEDYKEKYIDLIPLFTREEFKTFVDLRQKIINMPQYKQHKKNAKSTNLDGSTLSNIICDLEKDIMLCVKNYLDEKNIKSSSIIYDGIFVDNKEEIDVEDVESFIKENLNLEIVFNLKQIEEPDPTELFEEYNYEFGKKDEEEKKTPLQKF